ncbi:MAG: polyprenol monophosphomannose synthase, partial [Acidimicrobiia bacterium]
DSSPDGTGELADELAASDGATTVLHRESKEGLGAAYADGFEAALSAGPAVVCEMDADFSHDPDSLVDLVAAIEEGAEVAVGSRYVPGGGTPDWPWHRKLISVGGNLYARWALGLDIHDATGGFRAFRADVLSDLDPATAQASGYAFQVEIIWRASERELRIAEVPIIFRDRRYGRSKMSGTIVLEAMWLVTRWGWGRFRRRLGWRDREV